MADYFLSTFFEVIIFIFILPLRLRHMFEHNFFSSSLILYKKITLSNKIQLSVVSCCNKAKKSKLIKCWFVLLEFICLWSVARNRYIQRDCLVEILVCWMSTGRWW